MRSSAPEMLFASLFGKGATVGLFVVGIFMPRGGSTAGGKAAARNVDSAANYAARHVDDVGVADDVQAIYKVTDTIDAARDANTAATTIDDAHTIHVFDDLPCVPNSFVAGTLVESIDGVVPIETLTEGDLVWAVDPETGAAGWYPITWTTKHEDADLVTLSVTLLNADGEALSSTQERTVVVTITATLEHPFWVEGIGWIDAGDLKTGDVLLSADGRRLVVQAAVRSSGPAMVYNFTVDALHTYTVTQLRVVVHNVDDFCKFDDKIAAKLAGNRDDRLEGQVGTWLRDKLVGFDDPIRVNGIDIGQIDAETAEFIIEVTNKNGGKLDQLEKLLNNTTINPTRKCVILYAPQMKKHAMNSIETTFNQDEIQVYIARNQQELLDLIQ